MWSIKKGRRREVEREKEKRQREARTETGKETALEQILLFWQANTTYFRGPCVAWSPWDRWQVIKTHFS